MQTDFLNTLSKNRLREAFYVLLFVASCAVLFSQLVFFAQYDKELYGSILGSAIGSLGAAIVALFSIYASVKVDAAMRDRKAYGRAQAQLNSALSALSFIRGRMKDYEAVAKGGKFSVVYQDRVTFELSAELASDFLKNEVANEWSSILGEFRRAEDAANTFLRMNARISELAISGAIESRQLTQMTLDTATNLEPVYKHFELVFKKAATIFAYADLLNRTERSPIFLFFPNKKLTPSQRASFKLLYTKALSKMTELSEKNHSELRQAGVTDKPFEAD